MMRIFRIVALAYEAIHLLSLLFSSPGGEKGEEALVFTVYKVDDNSPEHEYIRVWSSRVQ